MDPLPPPPTLMKMTDQDLSSFLGKFLRKFKLLPTIIIILTLSTHDILESEFKLNAFYSLFHQHGGDMEKAAHCMDEARSLDTADRYVNCKCAKYQLRANQVQKAEDTCGLFTRVSIRCKSSDVMLCMYIYVLPFVILVCWRTCKLTGVSCRHCLSSLCGALWP